MAADGGVNVRALAPGVHAIGGRRGGRVHAFLLDGGDGALTLIDTMYETDGGPVLAALRAVGRPVSDLRQILLTHAHRSHLGGLAALKRASGATVYAHRWEADIVAGERKAQPAGFRPARPLLAYAPMYRYQLGLALGMGAHPPCPVDESLRDGDRVGPVEVVYADGHSPGHVAFWWRERRALFAGDAVATWPVFADGWPALTLNRRRHRASLERLAALRPAVVGVGHGDPIADDAADRLTSLLDGGAG